MNPAASRSARMFLALLLLSALVLTACGGGQSAPKPAAPAAPAPAAPAAPAQAPKPAASETITTAKLGAVYAVTGPFAIYFPTIKNGMEMARDELNAKGDLKLEITLEDDRSNKDDAINVYQKFIQRDNMLVILGPLTGGQTFAAAPLAQKAATPVMLTSVATVGATGVGDYVFRTSVESREIIPGTVAAAKDKFGVKKVAMIVTNDDQFSVGEKEAFEAAFKAAGIQILTIETVRTGDVDFSAQLTKIKGLGPDAISLSTQGQEAVGIMTQARSLGILQSVRFLGGNAFNSAGVVKEAGKAMEGALSATPWFVDMPHEKNKQFVARYREKFKSDPDWLSAQTYDALFVVKQAILDAKVGKADDVATARKKIRDALARLKTFDGVLGRITFKDNRDPSVPGAIIAVENGKHVLLK